MPKKEEFVLEYLESMRAELQAAYIKVLALIDRVKEDIKRLNLDKE